MTPPTLYYLLLYVFILIVRFFKLFPSVRDHPDSYSWRHYGFIGLEVVYTAAGLVALLLANFQDWIPAIMLGYLILAVVSAFLETIGQRFTEKTRFVLHIAIVILVLTGTILSFESLLATPPPTEQTGSTSQRYRVAIPYFDLTLDRHLGVGRLGERQFFYTAVVDATSRSEAVQKAGADFRANVRPFDDKAEATVCNVSMGVDVVVELDQVEVSRLTSR